MRRRFLFLSCCLAKRVMVRQLRSILLRYFSKLPFCENSSTCESGSLSKDRVSSDEKDAMIALAVLASELHFNSTPCNEQPAACAEFKDVKKLKPIMRLNVILEIFIVTP